MSEENKNNLQENESIEDILKSFQRQKDDREHGIAPAIDREKEQIDFAKTEEDTDEKSSEGLKKPEKSRAKKERKKVDIKAAIKAIVKSKGFKKTVIVVLAVTLAVGAIFGSAAGIKKLKAYNAVAYLKPYQEKYPDVDFPTGILEEYCDIYGKNTATLGKITISDIKLEEVVATKESDKKPYAESSLKNSTIANYVIYLQDNTLEEYYKDADTYNSKASGFMEFNNMFESMHFKVVGAFYTNTKAEDDNGYIFPYNVTEKMTPKSTSSFIDRLNTRFMYKTNASIVRDDVLLTVSCPTDYRKNFRFVVVGVLREDKEKLTAQPKTSVRYPQVIFDELGKKNNFVPSEKWYPEIVLTDKNGNESIAAQSIKDFE